jgi:hypothetical protein
MGDKPKHGFIRDHEPWKYKHGFIPEALMNCVFTLESIFDKHLEGVERDDPVMKGLLENFEECTNWLSGMQDDLMIETANVTNVDGCPKCLEAAGLRRED